MSTTEESSASGLLIGALSTLTNCNIETIRYYERIGLMPSPPRTAGGRRVYEQPHVQRLTFTRRGRELGFTLGEVRGLLRLVESECYTCKEVRTITLNHLTEVRRKISDLRRLAAVLKDMADECASGTVPA